MEQPTTEQPPEDAGELVIRQVKIPCRVPLEGQRHALFGAALAQAGRELRKMREAEKERAQAARKLITEKDEEVQRLENDVDSNSTDGEVDGIEEWDYRRFEVRTTRLDTNTTAERAMSAEERNAYLDAQPEPPPKQPELPFGKVPGEDEPDDAAPESSVKNGQRLVKAKRGRKAKAEGATT